MNTLAKKIRFDQNNLWVDLVDGRQLAVPLVYFPRLLEASEAQRNEYVLSGGGVGIHWDVLDEDISVAGLMAGFGDRSVLKNLVADSL